MAPQSPRRRFALLRLGLITVLAATLLSTLPHGHAEAAASSCRSDPVIVVNGAVFDIVSTLSTKPSAIRELDYTVTVPSGSVTGQTQLTVGLGFPERVTYVFSQAQKWGTMSVAATVVTPVGVARFPTSVQVTSLLGIRQAAGWSDSTVTVTASSLLML